MNAVPEPQTRLAKLRVGADHPSLPGHFPGRPIVPAVVLLNHIVDCAVEQFGATMRIRGIEQAKFLIPLLPDQEALATLTWASSHLKFKVVSEGAAEETIVAQGSFTVELPP